MISIICVYNAERILHNCLLKSLSKQKKDFELICVNNTTNRFKSAAEALNWGATRAAGKYLMFVHQDIDLCSDSWFDGTEELLDSLPNLGIAGVAGISEQGGPRVQQLRNTIHRKPPTRYRNVITHSSEKERWGTPIVEPELVQTLDECLVIVPKTVFKDMSFDEVTCDSWHLYAVDYCLSVKTLGFEVYVIPKYIYHKTSGQKTGAMRVVASLGSLPEEYYRTLEHILKKHHDHYKWIHTSCSSWNTTYPLALQRAKLVLIYLILSIIFRISKNRR